MQCHIAQIDFNLELEFLHFPHFELSRDPVFAQYKLLIIIIIIVIDIVLLSLLIELFRMRDRGCSCGKMTKIFI